VHVFVCCISHLSLSCLFIYVLSIHIQSDVSNLSSVEENISHMNVSGDSTSSAPSSISSSLSSPSSASSAGEGQADSVILLGDDLLADIEVDEFRRQVLDYLRCLIENKSVYIQQLGVRQDDNECTVISVLTAIIHAHSADGRVSNELFCSVITTLGIAVANKVRHLGSQSQFSYLDLESVKQFLQSFLDVVTTHETSEIDMFMNSTVRKNFLSQLVSDKRVAHGECLKLSVHVPTFATLDLTNVCTFSFPIKWSYLHSHKQG